MFRRVINKLLLSFRFLKEIIKLNLFFKNLLLFRRIPLLMSFFKKNQTLVISFTSTDVFTISQETTNNPKILLNFYILLSTMKSLAIY